MGLSFWDSGRFGAKIKALLGAGDRLPELAPKSGDPSVLETLNKLCESPDAPAPSLRAGLFLYFDHLDPAHKIAQEIENPDGSFWHGIMHRREPDDENSAHWFRSTGRHPALSTLGPPASALIRASKEKSLEKDLMPSGAWDPFAFIRTCSEARKAGTPGRVQLLRELQLLEWRVLFDHCFDKGEKS